METRKGLKTPVLSSFIAPKNKTNENKKLKDTNQTLRIKIDELSSFERMSNIASKQGLENREGTIKNVR